MRIVLAEDETIMRDLLRHICVEVLGHTVVGEAASGPEAITQVFQIHPEILILDIAMPGLDGLGVLDRIRDFEAIPKVIILTAFCNTLTVYRAKYSFIRGFIDKGSCRIDVLQSAIATIGEGGVYFSAPYRTIKNQLHSNDIRNRINFLSERERQVLIFVGTLLADYEIADRLAISEDTVLKHRFNIQKKMDIGSRLELVRFARSMGFMNNTTAS